MLKYQEILNNNGDNVFYTTYSPLANTFTIYIEGIFQPPDKYAIDGNKITILDTDLIPSSYNVTTVYNYESFNTPQAAAITSTGNIVISVSSTIVTGGDVFETKYMLADVNNIPVAIELNKISLSTPDIDFMTPYTDLVIDNVTIVDNISSYGNVGVAVNIYDSLTPCASALSNYALKVFKLTKQNNTTPTIQFKTPTIVGNTVETGNYLVAKINNEAWGIKVHNYSTVFPFNNAVVQADVNVTTSIDINPTQFDAPRDAGSTNLNSKIKTYSDLIKRVKMHLGWPIVQLEICDEQIVEHIDTALEWYTKYAGYTEEFLAFDSGNYICGYGLEVDKIFSQLYCMSHCEPRMGNKRADGTPTQKQFIDFDLDSYRKVVDVWSFDEADGQQSDYLFSLEYVFAQQTYFSYVLGNYGFDLVTWHILKDWIDTREKMFAIKRRVYFDDRKQVLKLIPEPGDARFIGILGCYVEKPIKDLISERWIYQYTSALSKITIGNIRGKFTSVSMFGGGTVNYNDLLSQGLEEKKKLEEELLNQHGEVAPIKFFVG